MPELSLPAPAPARSVPVPAFTLAPAEAALCRSLLRAGSRSFHAASLLLPRRMRLPAAAIYAFCRVADDAIDEVDRDLDEVDEDRDDAEAALARLRLRLASIYGEAPLADPVDRAFRAVARAHAIPQAVPEALLEGFAWDAAGRRYRDLGDLRAYGVRVASTVGLMMTCVAGPLSPRHDPVAVLARACDLGVAMQLTNIARDVGEDARRGRLYLPLDRLAAEGIDPEAFLAAPRSSPALSRVIEGLLQEADRLYARADAGIAMLPWDVRVAIRAARLIYAEIGQVIRRGGADPVTGRAVTSPGRKLLLALRSLPAALPWTPPPDLAQAPALPEARALLAALARP